MKMKNDNLEIVMEQELFDNALGGILTDLTSHAGLGVNRAIFLLYCQSQGHLIGKRGVGPINEKDFSKWEIAGRQSYDEQRRNASEKSELDEIVSEMFVPFKSYQENTRGTRELFFIDSSGYIADVLKTNHLHTAGNIGVSNIFEPSKGLIGTFFYENFPPYKDQITVNDLKIIQGYASQIAVYAARLNCAMVDKQNKVCEDGIRNDLTPLGGEAKMMDRRIGNLINELQGKVYGNRVMNREVTELISYVVDNLDKLRKSPQEMSMIIKEMEKAYSANRITNEIPIERITTLPQGAYSCISGNQTTH